jgi:hypothetical protein
MLLCTTYGEDIADSVNGGEYSTLRVVISYHERRQGNYDRVSSNLHT